MEKLPQRTKILVRGTVGRKLSRNIAAHIPNHSKDKREKESLNMNKKPLVPLLVLTILTCVGIILTYTISKPADNKPVAENNVETPKIIVDYPKPDDIVTSPLVVKGRARGTWFFEGDFPVTLYYGVGEDFVDTYATAKGEWMTEDYVEFETTINFPVPPINDGLLVLMKNNPSDLEENNEYVQIKVRFH